MFAGRSASRRVRYGYHSVPYGMYTRTGYPSPASCACRSRRTPYSIWNSTRDQPSSSPSTRRRTPSMQRAGRASRRRSVPRVEQRREQPREARGRPSRLPREHDVGRLEVGALHQPDPAARAAARTDRRASAAGTTGARRRPRVALVRRARTPRACVDVAVAPPCRSSRRARLGRRRRGSARRSPGTRRPTRRARAA